MFNSTVIEKIEEFGPYISPRRDRDAPLYNWHGFKHSYSKGLVGKLIEDFELDKGSWVLDPFCGGGTTLLACKEFGINSKGFDILPFSVFLSNVKTRTYNTEKLKQRLVNFEGNGKFDSASLELPDIEIMNKAFDNEVKIKLLELKGKINRIREGDIRDFYTLGLLSILESLSNTNKAGGFLRIIKRDIDPDDVYPKFFEKINRMIEDVESFNDRIKFSNVKVNAQLSDSRRLSTKRKFDAVITSPPYPNRHDYTRIYGLEMIFNFVESNDELKKIRYNTLRSHVEARKKFDSNDYKKPAVIDELITKVEERGTNNLKVTEMIEGYFEDMYLPIERAM